ncbi:MAG: hypothetical protein ACW98D_22005 [Promethearchaeota archaeon]|jgi:hypothetical protein
MYRIFQQILKSPDVKIVFSILWGLGLAALFRRVCKGRNCINFKAPKPVDIQGKTFSFNKKCYNYTPRMVKCEGEIIPPEEFKCFD